MKKLLVKGIFVAIYMVPVFAFAASHAVTPDFRYITNLLTEINTIFSYILPIIIAIGVIYFIWNMIAYVVSGNDDAKAQAKQRIGYGVLGLVLIFGIWGIIEIVVGLLGVDDTATPFNVPELPTYRGPSYIPG